MQLQGPAAARSRPLNLQIDDVDKDMIIPAKQGTLSILKSAAKHSSVKRVVVTGSFAAVLSLDEQDPYRPGFTYSHEHYNPATEESSKEKFKADKQASGAYVYWSVLRILGRPDLAAPPRSSPSVQPRNGSSRTSRPSRSPNSCHHSFSVLRRILSSRWTT